MKYETISKNPVIQARYVELRKAGNTHKFAEMLAMQQAPKVNNTYSPMHPRRNRGRGF